MANLEGSLHFIFVIDVFAGFTVLLLGASRYNMSHYDPCDWKLLRGLRKRLSLQENVKEISRVLHDNLQKQVSF